MFLGSGKFEIVDGVATVIDGCIKTSENESFVNIEIGQEGGRAVDTIAKDDFYKELRLRGYQYFDKFQAVEEARAADSRGFGKILWNSNYVTLTDCMLQLIIVGNDSRDLFLPTSIRKFSINPKLHGEILSKIPGDMKILDVIVDPYLRVIQCGGIEISGLDASFVNRRRLPHEPVLEVNTFMPHFSLESLSKLDMAKFCCQLALENSPSLRVLLVEIDAGDEKPPLSETLHEALQKMPLIMSNLTYVTEKEIELKNVAVQKEDLSSFSSVNIIVKSNCIEDEKFLQEALDKLDTVGFVLSRESCQLTNIQLPETFNCIACIATHDEFIYMLKCNKSEPNPLLNILEVPAGFEDFNWIENLKEDLAKGPIVVHSRSDGDDVSGLLGLVNCLRKEANGQHVRCFLIDDKSAPDFDLDSEFYKRQLSFGLVMNVYRKGQWGSYKHLSLPVDVESMPRGNHCFANLLSRGDLSSLTWLTGPLDKTKSNLVEIHYSALNFRDILVATRRIVLDYELKNRVKRQYVCGYEFSGISSKGRKVMGVASSRAFSTHLDEDEELLMIEIPDRWTLEEAATVPIVYITVYIAFFITTQIEKNKSILIHAGSGGVGLAAIRVAFAYDLNVFTTVSSDEKKKYLLDEFPQLKPENIGNSRDTSFEQMVMTRTSGKGVDYVLNSLSEEKMQASIRCLAENGFFLEVGKFDMLMKNQIHLSHFLKGITFKAVLFKVSDMLHGEARARVSV